MENIENAETLSDLRGVLAVAREEGAQLGSVSRLFIDPTEKVMSGLAIRTGFRKEAFVKMDEVVQVGRDVLSITSVDVPSYEVPTGRDLKSLQGSYVTTLSGKQLGTLADIEVSPSGWDITELRFADGRRLPVEASKITMGDDEILVPADYEARVVSPDDGDRQGFLGRLFGANPTDDAQSALTQVSRKALETFGDRGTSDETRDDASRKAK